MSANKVPAVTEISHVVALNRIKDGQIIDALNAAWNHDRQGIKLLTNMLEGDKGMVV